MPPGEPGQLQVAIEPICGRFGRAQDHFLSARIGAIG
jgi:hypothetical protein